LKFGYHVMPGNGGGSDELPDNDKSKFLTLADNF
jgi:hypothetical protein